MGDSNLLEKFMVPVHQCSQLLVVFFRQSSNRSFRDSRRFIDVFPKELDFRFGPLHNGAHQALGGTMNPRIANDNHRHSPKPQRCDFVRFGKLKDTAVGTRGLIHPGGVSVEVAFGRESDLTNLLPFQLYTVSTGRGCYDCNRGGGRGAQTCSYWYFTVNI